MARASNLTDAFISAAKPVSGKQIEYPDGKVPGLALRVSAQGKKAWTFRFRNKEGQQRRLSLGTYPAVPLVKARQMAVEALGETHDGKDPAQEKRDEKARANLRVIRTVSDLAEEYFSAARLGRHRNEARPKRQSTLDMEEGYFNRLIKPKFGAIGLPDVLRPDLQRFLDDLGKSSPSAARQCRNIIRQMFNFAIRREIIDKNPAQFADVPTSKSRERVLAEAEVKAIWLQCKNYATADGFHLSPAMALAIQLAMVTLQRGNEVCAAALTEFDLDAKIWTIPGNRTKNHRSHVVPLSDLAISIVKRAIALPAPSPNPDIHSKFIRPLFGVLRNGKPLTRHALTRAMKRITKHLNIADATPHDFRRTGSTQMTSERLGVPRFHVSAVLNHVSDSGGAAAVTAVYDRNSYLPEKRRALEKWAGRLLQVTNELPDASNVVRLKEQSS